MVCDIRFLPRKHLSCDAFVVFGCERIVRDGPLYMHMNFGDQIDKLARVTFMQYMSLVTQFMSLHCYTFHGIWNTLGLTPSGVTSQIAKFMGPTWGPPGTCRPQMGPILAPWTLLSGALWFTSAPSVSLLWHMRYIWWHICGFHICIS